MASKLLIFLTKQAQQIRLGKYTVAQQSYLGENEWVLTDGL